MNDYSLYSEFNEINKSLDKDAIKEINSACFILSTLGIKIVDSKIDREYKGDTPIGRIIPKTKFKYYFTIPESSELSIPVDDFPEDITDTTSQENLIKIAKFIIKSINKIYIKHIEPDMFDTGDEIEEFFNETQNFYAKVREGDHWTKDKANDLINKMMSEIKAKTGFNEV